VSDYTLHVGDVRDVLPTLETGSVDCVVTSPPYLDARPEYGTLVGPEWVPIFRHLARVVRGGMLWNVGRLWRDGTERLWWTGLLDDAERAGWQLHDTLVWVKPNANPIHGQIVADSHEYIFALGRPDTVWNTDGIRTEYAPSTIPRMKRKWINGRGVKGDHRPDQNGREVNELGARARSFIISYVGCEKGNKHPAPMPLDVAEDLVSLASWPGGVVLDPFGGSGTTAVAARRLRRRGVLIELNEEYAQMARERLARWWQPLARAEQSPEDQMSLLAVADSK
jgi:DNA modification methylase